MQATIQTEQELRYSFWDAHPQFAADYVESRPQNAYRADIRCAWVDYVEHMQRDGQITGDLASTATL